VKDKVLIVLLITASLFGYLEWGGDNRLFLFQAEYDVFRKLLSNPGDVIHPFTLLPLLGQVCLVIALFQKSPSRMLVFTGIACVGLLLVFIFFIGVVGPNFKMLVSAVPFLVLSVVFIMGRGIRNSRI
jgi:hypothetical protein